MTDAYKKEIRDRLAWVKAERAAGREPSDVIHQPVTDPERAAAYRKWALERRELGLPISLQAIMK